MNENVTLETDNQNSLIETSGHSDAEKLSVSISKAPFVKAIAHVQSVVEKRTTIPILSHVKLEANDTSLRLTATDMDIAIVEEVEAEVKAEGSLTVPAQTLYDIIRKLPDEGNINLSVDNGKLFIKAHQCDFELPILDAAEFPAMDKGELPFIFQLPTENLTTLIEKTKFAISTEETRYYLNGIYLHVVNDEASILRAVATDGHRLANVEVPMPAGAAAMPSVIIPRKAVLELRKLLDQDIENVQVALSENKIRFVCGKAVLLSKLIDGTFPDYKKVIPQNNDKLLEVEVSSLSDAVDRVSVISSDKIRVVKFALSNGKLQLSSMGHETGSATEEMSVNYDSDSLEIGFNSRYLIEMLSQIEGEVVQFLLSSGTSPTLVKDPADINAVYVIMPMRV
ncbi:MAG: DNA polymerase III subunit beta [Rickettsiales bacterium]|nr:DNA polymerase III subunit beta [Rickettsiales bacterium]